MTSPSRTFLQRVQIRNYKSIGRCRITLRPLSVLVGRNGAGKSNVLDALSFLTDAVQLSLDQAIKLRGGVDSVRRRSTGHPRNFSIGLELTLPSGDIARYEFEIAARSPAGFIVKDESLRIGTPDQPFRSHYHVQYIQETGVVVDASEPNMPPVSADRLYLVNAAGLPAFRPAFDALASMGFYNLNPLQMKELQPPDAGELLHRDGTNIASVIARLGTGKPEIKERIKAYLEKIVPGISDVERVSLGPRETLEFRQTVSGARNPWRFYAANMSDGTLRALGTLVAVMQLADKSSPVTLVGIEEPETALHPAASGALVDALREASVHTQVLVTSHSPDLLDQFDVESDGILAVAAESGETRIAPVNPPSREAMKQHLYSAGELLRMDQLQPDEEDVRGQLSFWGEEDPASTGS
jgi:predicted ATPase